MRLRSKLNHSCTIQQSGQVKVGEDDYGRDIFEKPDPIENVPCRFEKRITKDYDENGINQNEELSMMFLPDSGVVDSTIISNVKDADGNTLYSGDLTVEFLSLGMGRRTVDHIVVTLGEA